MQFSVEQIRSVRNRYLEPPYPGFSLEEVCRRRRMMQTKLMRGENAWTAKGTAQTTEEWVSRLVQGSLNKLSERNFEELMGKLRTKELFSTSEILTSVVTMIFEKALNEPENSKLYAVVCFNLAKYEIGLNDPDTARPKSELRNAIVATAQKEFRQFRREETDRDRDLTEEEREQLRLNFMRRKRANIRFVGELFLNGVLSHGTIFSILEVIMKAAAEGGYPESENIEILAELLRTIGECMDRQQKARMDYYFELLAGLIKRPDNPYPHRIRFKIMDLLDLRRSAWGTKPRPPQSLKASSASAAKGSSTAAVSKKGTPKAAEGVSRTWKDMVAAKASATPQGGGATAAGQATSLNQRGTIATHGSSAKGASDAVLSSSTMETPSSPATAGAGVLSAVLPSASQPSGSPVVKFELRVRTLFQEWVADCSNDFIPQWIETFNDCDRVFESVEELCVAVAVEVITEACVTTRKDAQREACSFLIVGLYLLDAEMLQGFTGALAAAIEDGVLEDVPRYAERFMQILRLTSTEDEVDADVYYDAANVLCMAYNQLSDTDETTVETLLGFWHKVPQLKPDEEAVILGFPVIYSLCEPARPKEGLEKLLSAIIYSLHEMGIVEDDTSEELLTSDIPHNAFYNKVVQEYKRLLTEKAGV